MAKKNKIQPGPKWIYDNSPIPDPQGRAARALKNISLLRHHKTGEPIRLDPWQRRIIERIYGPSNPDGSRQVRTVFILMGRGNRKSSLAALIIILHLFFQERVKAGRVVSAAASLGQTEFVFNEVMGVIEETPKLADPKVSRILDSKHIISHVKSGATYEAISTGESANKKSNKFGDSINLAVVDELSEWPTRNLGLWRAIQTGVNKVQNSLLVILTMAGAGNESLDYPIYDYARRVQSGEIDDPGYLPIIFEATKDADWKSEELWAAVNPGIKHGYPDLARLRQFARECEHRPADQDAFRQLHLSMRAEYSVSPYVDMDVFRTGRTEIDLAEFAGEDCWVSIDASQIRDLTGVMAVFKRDGNYFCKCWAFVPEKDIQLREDRDGVSYPRWRREGWIVATPGEVIDFRAVEQFIRKEILEKFNVRDIVTDTAPYAQPIVGPLTDDGYPTTTIRQGWITQSPALNLLEAAVITGKVKYDSPVLEWCMSNVRIKILDEAGNRVMRKGMSKDRIDLATCLWEAVSRAAADEGGNSILGGENFNPQDFLIPMWS